MKVVDNKSTRKDNKKIKQQTFLGPKFDVCCKENHNNIKLASDKNQNKGF